MTLDKLLERKTAEILIVEMDMDTHCSITIFDAETISLASLEETFKSTIKNSKCVEKNVRIFKTKTNSNNFFDRLKQISKTELISSF